MLRLPFLESVFWLGRQRRGVEYHSDRCAVALDNLNGIGASLPRRPNGSGDIRLTYRGGAAGHGYS
jgi:hypothetical protein